MRKGILDEVDKNTGPRTCPECGYQFPFGKFLRQFVVTFGLPKWPCQNCRELLKCDYIKIQTMWYVGLLISGIAFGVLRSFFDLDLSAMIFLIANFAFILLTLFYVKFEKYN